MTSPASFVCVADAEGHEKVELPVEEDGSLLLTTLTAQFPGTCGLRYRNPENLSWRGVRLADGKLSIPENKSWGSFEYITVHPKERHICDKTDDPIALEDSGGGGSGGVYGLKYKKDSSRCSDLIVLGLPWKTTEGELREYFETFGRVLMAQIKKDGKNGLSKGFGFIRFADYSSQMKVVDQRHLIENRWCDVKIPNSKETNSQQIPCKIFVGRCTEDMSAEDLEKYFSKFGEITDIFIPKPFRAFAFITFTEPEVAQALCGEDHIVNGVSVHISTAAPKIDQLSLYRRIDMPNNFNPNYCSNRYDKSYNSLSSSYGGGSIWTPPNRGGSIWAPANRGASLELPNLQALGLGNGSTNHPAGMNLPHMNQALAQAAAAAAMTHATWGLMHSGAGASHTEDLSQSFNNHDASGRGSSSNSMVAPWATGPSQSAPISAEHPSNCWPQSDKGVHSKNSNWKYDV